MTRQQQYLRTLARRSGLFYCTNCGEEPPIHNGGLCEICNANRRTSETRTAGERRRTAGEQLLRDV